MTGADDISARHWIHRPSSQVGGANHNKEQRTYDRRRLQGAGPASNVAWAACCTSW